MLDLPIHRLASFVLLLVSASAAAAANPVFDSTILGRMAALKRGESVSIDAFPAGPTRRASIRFESVSVYSDDARIFVRTAKGEKEIPRSDRIFLRGYADDGTRIALSLNADGSFAEGSGSGPEGSFVLHSGVGPQADLLAAQALETTLPTGFDFQFACGNESATLDVHSLVPGGTAATSTSTTSASNALASALDAATASSITLRVATVAVDTDSLFMSRLFANDTTKAANWIASLFNSMNVMYERDLAVQLKQGTTFLCGNGCSDPYTGANHIPADTSDLNIFGAYWKNHYANVTRAFAILLSGQETSTAQSCSASGIAWLEAYCQKGTTQNSNTFGSYSVNQVCTSIGIDPNATFNARIVGHELGHNFGADHTHCTNATTGVARTANNTIDQCYNKESSCYSGTPSCPAAGAGTIMSYCNLSSVSGCASGTQNLMQFHPTQISKVLLPDIAAAPLGCLNTNDVVFSNGFQ